MIDLRRHLLEGTGCGPSGFAESVRMCAQARAEGVRVVVASVRWAKGAGEPPLSFDEYEGRLERLRREARDAPALLPGFVLQFDDGLPGLAEKYGRRLALGGGRHVLVSLPALETPAGAEGVWEGLAAQGLGVVLARPECGPALRRDPSRLDAWAEGGALRIQLDAASVTGAYGREVQRFAWRCLERHSAQGRVLVASNARDAAAPRASLGEAAGAVAKRLGRRRARSIFEDIPALVLGGARPSEGRAPALPTLAASAARARLAALLRSLTGRKTLPEEG